MFCTISSEILGDDLLSLNNKIILQIKKKQQLKKIINLFLFIFQLIITFYLIAFLLSLCLASLDNKELVDKHQIKIHQRGSHQEYPSKGDTVKVHNTGKLLDGTKFDSSKDRNQPFEFKVGVGQVIQCWDEVVQNLTLGDKVTVICPSQTAYGTRCAGRVIPPNSDLQFDIDMLGFRDQEL